MPTPDTSLSVVRPDLRDSMEEFDLQADREGYIGHRVLPVVEVDQATGQFGIIPIEQLLQERDTARSARSGYARGDWTFTKSSYATEEQGAEEPELGPMAITTLLSGSKGFTPAGTSS